MRAKNESGRYFFADGPIKLHWFALFGRFDLVHGVGRSIWSGFDMGSVDRDTQTVALAAPTNTPLL